MRAVGGLGGKDARLTLLVHFAEWVAVENGVSLFVPYGNAREVLIEVAALSDELSLLSPRMRSSLGGPDAV